MTKKRRDNKYPPTLKRTPKTLPANIKTIKATSKNLHFQKHNIVKYDVCENGTAKRECF
jgi:hypothetical protein